MALLEMRGVSGEFDEPIYPTGTPRTITTSSGQTYNYDDIVNVILARYAEGKNPALAVKSALQLGFPEDVIRTLPGVDDQAFEAGKELIESGAFAEQATGTMADIQQAAPVGSAQYNARIAAGLDAFGFPPEEVARLTAQGLYGPGRQFDPGTPDRQIQSASASETGLLAQGTGMAQTSPNVLGQKAASVVANSGVANDPRFADSIVGTFVDKGITYNVQGDGSFTTISETPDQVVTTTTFTPEGQEVGTYVDDRFQTTNLDRVLDIGANALMAAGTAAALGPAGVGLLGIPGAAAAGAGTTSLIRTGSVQDALKAAALAGAAAYGLDYLTASPELLAARELASSGMSEDAIIDTLISRGVSTNAAIEAASNATGLPAPGSARGLGDFTSTGATSVPVTGTAGTGVGAIAPAAAVLPVVSAVTPGLLNQAATQQVQVQSQTGGTQQAATEAIPAAGAGLLAQTQTVPVTSQTGATTQQTAAPVANLLAAAAPTQTVPITSQTAPTTQQAAGPGGAMLGTAIAPTQTVPIESRTIPTQERAVTIPVVPSESVTVQGKREPVPTATALIPAGAAGAAAGVTKPATPTSNITATDAALAALLLGGAGSLLNQSQSGGFTMDPNLANAIINAPRPVYRGGVGGYQMPGMFQISPTDVYNPFATTAPFGTGRFGGFAAPITLPYGLLATETNPVGMRLTTPTRGLA